MREVTGPGYANFYDDKDTCLFSVPCSTPKAAAKLADRLFLQDDHITDWSYTEEPMGKVGEV